MPSLTYSCNADGIPHFEGGIRRCRAARDLDGAYQRGDYTNAARILRRLANQGESAQNDLGLAYHYGQGVQQDDSEAVKWFRKAADQGYADAEFYLGRSYEGGVGVPRNYAEAVKWFGKAADQGHANAQNDIGVAYLNGQGVPQNYFEAVKWFRRSSEQGNANGQWMLGKMYQDGRGVQQDYIQAYMWSNLAVGRLTRAEDRDFVVKIRNSIAAAMSSTQIALAQKMSKGCLESNYRDCGVQSQQIVRREINSAPPTVSTSPAQSPNLSSEMGVLLKKVGGTFVVPVQINGAITLDFIIDSGAADVSVPLDVFSTLTRTGTIKDTDVIGEQTYLLADGLKSQSVTFTIRSLKVADIVVENVKASVSPAQGSLLLGQSFLEHFKSWSIDNSRQSLVLVPKQAETSTNLTSPSSITKTPSLTPDETAMVLGTLSVSVKECGVKTTNAPLNVAIAQLGQDVVDFDPENRYAALVNVKIKKANEFIISKGKTYACKAMREVLRRYIPDVLSSAR